VEIVLGVSMTPTTVRMALVEGEKADGVILEHDVFDITAINGSATSGTSDDVIAAILGTQEGAIVNGHHLVSTGVAWSDHAQAAALREALESRGIEDVLLVSELHAAVALAKAVGRAVGYDTTALMFVERDTATLALVETADGSVMRVLSQSQSLTALRHSNSLQWPERRLSRRYLRGGKAPDRRLIHDRSRTSARAGSSRKRSARKSSARSKDCTSASPISSCASPPSKPR